ncbi:MAG: metal ABC transporter ATP-binding protein [Deinococcales bacterium]
MSTVLSYQQVSLNFGEVKALQQISFSLAQGEFLAIIGPNGAGKSTLMKLALGLLKPSQGDIKIFGAAPGHYPEKIGYVPQLKQFDRSFPASPLELVASGLRRTWVARVRREEREKSLLALEQVGAHKLIHRPLAKLSGGELQRVFLARALVREPELIMLDEPATGVDFIAEHDLYDLLERYRHQHPVTLAIITHDLAAARYHTSKVLVLNRRLHGFGLPQDVMCESCLQEAFGHIGHYHALTRY